MVIALAAGLAAAAVAVAAPALIQAVAGLALLGSMAGALRAAHEAALAIPLASLKELSDSVSDA